MSIIITLIVSLIVLGLIWWLVQMIPLPAPIAQIVQVLFVLLAIVMVLGAFGIIPGVSLPHIRI